MKIDIIGEDPVTYSIIERLIKEYRPDIIIANKLPSRGGEIKKLAPLYNKIAGHIFLLTDLDGYECPPSMIKGWFGDTTIVDTLLFRIAHDEAESWLMADKIGFSSWLGIDVEKMPPVKIIDSKKGINELSFPYKPSLYMMMTLVPESRNKELVSQLTPRTGAKKGPGYNSAMIPFIEEIWNIESASINSYSLRQAILRLKTFS